MKEITKEKFFLNFFKLTLKNCVYIQFFAVFVFIYSGCLPEADVSSDTANFGSSDAQGLSPDVFIFTLINSNSEYEISAANVNKLSGSIVIPDSYKDLPVSRVASKAFFNATNITSVFLPDSIKEIGDWAFRSCSDLEIIRIPEGLEIIGDWAFRDCEKLLRIEIPASVTVVGEWAFHSCNSLIINCEAPAKPDGWHDEWNYSNRPVIWGIERPPFDPHPGYSLIAAGKHHSLAIDKDGNLWAWGNNCNSAIGDGTTTTRSTPVQINTNGRMNNAKVVSVAAGGGHSFAIDEYGNLWAWGWNGWGQLGDGTQGAAFVKSSPVLINTNGRMNDAKVISIVAGYEHSLAIDKHGNLWAWGKNDSGQLGNGSRTYYSTPVLINTNGRMNNARILTVSTCGSGYGSHNLAIDEHGYLWAWGNNFSGQIGDGTFGYSANKTVPVLVNIDTRMNNAKIIHVAAGGNHSLAIDEYGDLWAWGLNSYPGGGQVGDSTRDDRHIPVQINSNGRMNNSKITSISAGGYISFAIDDLGNLWGWGSNYSGQLGNGEDDWFSISPELINTSGRMNNARAVNISAGESHCLSIDEHGNLWIWGFVAPVNSNIPVQIIIDKAAETEL